MNSKDFNEYNNNLINTNVNQNNDLISSQEFMFYFTNTKFLWKELMKLNTKYIERSADVSLITPYIQNILSSRLTLDNIDMISEEYIIQLVTLLQLTGQYLIYTQKMLEAENDQLRDNISYLKNNLSDNEKYQRIIDDLNRQNQEKDFLIKTYQDMIQTGNGINDNDSDKIKNKKMNLKNDPDYNSVKKIYYYCSICSGKKFKSQKYLDEHMERRHYNQKDLFKNSGDYEERKDQEKNYRKEFEEKLNLMKNELELMVKQKEENNEFALINKRLELLQNQIIQQNYNNIINPKSNSNFQNNVNYPQNYVKKESNVDYKKKYEESRKECKELAKINKEQEKFLKDLTEQLNQIGGGGTNNPKPDINNDFLTNKYNIVKNTEIYEKTNIERTKIKYNTNDINKNKDKGNEYENSNNIFNGIQKNTENIGNNKYNLNDFKNKNNINNNVPEITQNIQKKNEDYNKSNTDKNNKENDEKKFFNNEGFKTPMDEDTILKDVKENTNKPINNIIPQNNFNDVKILESSNQFESKNIQISQNIKDSDDEKIKTKIPKKINNEEPKINLSPLINSNDKVPEAYTLTLKEFYKKFDDRNKNFKGESDYDRINIPDKYKDEIENKINARKEEIKERLNDSNISNKVKKLIKDKDNRNSIYNRNYEKINEALKIQELINSYNNYQKEKNKNQMIVQNSSSKERISNDNSGYNTPHGNNRLSGNNRPSTDNRPSKQSYKLKNSVGDGDYKAPNDLKNPFNKK